LNFCFFSVKRKEKITEFRVSFSSGSGKVLPSRKILKMFVSTYPGEDKWSFWQKVLFRFFFGFFLIFIAPWLYLEYIPGVRYIMKYYYQLAEWLVYFFNDHLFHIREVLVPMNGSGDTSYGWAQTYCCMALAAIATVIWTVFSKKENHNGAAYWIRIILRYFLANICFSYGIDKMFLLQMPFPNTSQMATPLGDLLPMRLSWMYIGYSGTYQFFAGSLEVLAGILLLFRRTTTLGLFFAAGIFLNVMMMNLGYDIPVKLFSIQMFAICLFLLSFETKRILDFFIRNRPAPATSVYDVQFAKRWMRFGVIGLKAVFIILIVIMPGIDLFGIYEEEQLVSSDKNIPAGVYQVNTFVRNHDTISSFSSDTLCWQDVIIDNASAGSIKTTDTLFRRRYGRGYFNFKVNETTRTIDFSKNTMQGDSIFLFKMNYFLPDSNTIHLKGLLRSDSVFVSLKNTHRHFQLAERQFHWLSEYNR
jgi:uncharacterized membrane protein YphA (DoxX/SURF4 family)